MSYLDKCTEGDWAFDISRFDDSFCFDIFSDAGDHLLVFASAENESDASLMAASKKMYAALEDVMWFLENNHHQHSLDIDREEMKSLLEPVSNALSAARGEK